MSKLGILLKKYRNNLGLSMQEVTELTGITNSRLSKIERGKTLCPPSDLRKLASIYKVPLISLYIDAEYVDETDLREFQTVFTGVSLLDENEKQHIQDEINFLNRKKDNYGI